MSETLFARECVRCGRTVRVTKSRHMRAHNCPHGLVCVVPYSERKRGRKPAGCLQCFKKRQVPLPLPETPNESEPS